MKTRVQKWGNSLGLRIPKPLANEIDLRDGSEVDILSKHGKLLVEPRKKRYRLSDLIAAISDDNVHPELEIGRPQGKEVW